MKSPIKKFIFIGPLPPPYYGQSVAFQDLFNKLKYQNNLYVINIQSKFLSPGQGFTIIRAFEFISIFIRYFFILLKTKKHVDIYITVGQSPASFARDFFFINLAFIFGRKVYAHLKGGNFLNFYEQSNALLKTLISFTYKKTFKIILLGNSLKSNFSFSKSLETKINIVHNGLAWSSQSYIDKNPLKRKKINLIFLSNLIISKGYLDVIEAMSILKKRNLNFEINFIGDFIQSPDDLSTKKKVELKNDFFNLINKLSLNNHVNYLGTKNNIEKLNYLQKSDIFILPTFYMNEGQPISIIEAMATSNAIITTKFRSIVDLMREGKEGFFISKNNPKEIAEKIILFNEDRQLLWQTQKNAYNRYKGQFTREKHIKNMQKVLDIF